MSRRSHEMKMITRRVRVNRVKGSASRGFFGRWKWVLIPVSVLLLIPATQVAVVRKGGGTHAMRSDEWSATADSSIRRTCDL